MNFDIKTLLVAVALATMLSAVARILLWRTHPGMPGLGHWAGASVLGTGALLMIAMRNIVPEWLALSLAQLLIAVCFILTWDGFRRFVGRTPLSQPTLTVLIVFVIGLIVTSHVLQSLTLRASSNALWITLFSAMVARELLSAARPREIAMRVSGWLYAISAVLFLARGFAVAANDTIVDPWNPDGLAALPLFWWLCFTMGATLGMVLMASERLQRELDHQASRDPLTGALNRRALSMFAEKELARSRRNGQPLSVLMMDLDHFKAINDHLGHRGGDEILCRFVSASHRVLRTEDVFCRLGGEEFLALLPGIASEQALLVAERIRSAYRSEMENITALSLPFVATVSIGISQFRPEEEIDDVIHRADAALYQAKANGRNRCEMMEFCKAE